MSLAQNRYCKTENNGTERIKIYHQGTNIVREIMAQKELEAIFLSS